MESELSYLQALITYLHLYGDPRGRGNFSPTLSLGLLWKMSIFAHSIEKKADAEFIEELFDAAF